MSTLQSSYIADSRPVKFDSSTLDLHVDPPLYTYRPLTSERSIRVLKVHGADSYDTILTFEILEVCLDSPPEYYAISYCWEGQTPSQKVFCEGQMLLVTVNCEAALKQFRRHQDEAILLWIDAICINQDVKAVLERNHQVLMMGDVYATATQVWVWLGTDRLKPLSNDKLAMLKFLGDLSRIASRNSAEEDEAECLKTALQLRANVKFTKSMPWFTRIWVIQEVVLSKSAIFHRDETVIDYLGIIRAMNMVENSALKNSTLLHCQKVLFRHFRIFFRLESAKKISESPSQLRRILSSTRDYRSMDPRDKVFALHSLLSTAGLTLPAPDYTKDTETVYRETTKAIIRYEKKLSIFEYINGLDSLSNTSSWSPDFNERRMPLRPSGRNFRASGQSSPVYSFSANDTLLLCRGRVLEKLSVCGVALAYCDEHLGAPEKYLTWSRNLQPREEIWIDLLDSAPDFNSAILQVWQVHALRKFLSFVFSTRPTSQTQSDAFRELQSCFMSYMKNRSQSFYHIGKVGDWDEWSKNIMEEFSDKAQTLNPVPIPDFSKAIDQQHDEGMLWARDEQMGKFRYIRDCLKDSKASLVLKTTEFRILKRICHNQSQAALHHAITESAVYQTLFRASSTSSLGMAPHSIRDGDQIALIAGLRVPMIVRPRENGHYRMIAPAYICGIMNGEAWDKEWESKDGLLLQDLVFE